MVTGTQGDEPVLTFVEAASWLERRFGRRPNVATLWRWATRGIRGIRLSTIAMGRFRFTTERALERFITDVSAVERQFCPADQLPLEAGRDGAGDFNKAEMAAARRRREEAKEKAKQFLRQKLGTSRPRKAERA